MWLSRLQIIAAGALGCAIGFASSAICAENARAQSDESSTKKKVLVISSEEDTDEMTHLVQVAASHFRDLNAIVLLEIVSWKPRDVVAQVETARRTAAAHGAFSAIWIEKSSEEIFLFVSDKTSQQVFVQTFRGSGDDWEAECETIAALVRSALITWLEVIPQNANENTDTVSDWVPVTGDNDVSPEERRESSQGKRPEAFDAPIPMPQGSPKRQRATAIGRFEGGFAARMVHRDEPWTYNARLGAQLLLFEIASVGVAAQAGSALTLRIEDDDVRLHHFPFYLEMGIGHAFHRVEFNVSLSAVLDVSYFKVNDRFREDSTSRRLGMGVLFSAGYRVLPVMCLNLFVGADFFFKTARYNFQGDPVLLFGPTQPYLGFSLSFYTKPRHASSQ